MAVKFQGGKPVQQASPVFDARSIITGHKKAIAGLEEMSNGVSLLQKFAQRAGNQELIAFADKSRAAIQDVRMKINDLIIEQQNYLKPISR
jgi:hypothetical protein